MALLSIFRTRLEDASDVVIEWGGCEDDESGIGGFRWCLDVVSQADKTGHRVFSECFEKAWEDVGLAVQTSIDAIHLKKFHTIMVNVECSNKAGLYDTCDGRAGASTVRRRWSATPRSRRRRSARTTGCCGRAAAPGDRRRHDEDKQHRCGERRRVGAPHRSRHVGRRRRRRGDHADHAERRLGSDLPGALGQLALPR